jgi:hypothetical protein
MAATLAKRSANDIDDQSLKKRRCDDDAKEDTKEDDSKYKEPRDNDPREVTQATVDAEWAIFSATASTSTTRYVRWASAWERLEYHMWVQLDGNEAVLDSLSAWFDSHLDDDRPVNIDMVNALSASDVRTLVLHGGSDLLDDSDSGLVVGVICGLLTLPFEMDDVEDHDHLLRTDAMRCMFRTETLPSTIVAATGDAV